MIDIMLISFLPILIAILLGQSNINFWLQITYMIGLIFYSIHIYDYHKNIEKKIQTIESYIEKKEQ